MMTQASMRGYETARFFSFEAASAAVGRWLANDRKAGGRVAANSAKTARLVNDSGIFVLDGNGTWALALEFRSAQS
jgi:hypothetical protein